MPETFGSLLFDLASVPWPTTYSDWTLCLTEGKPGRVWIECELLLAMLGSGTVKYSDDFHRLFCEIGGKVGRLLAPGDYVVAEGTARPIRFAASAVAMRIGTFGGETFVFLPRPQSEGSFPDMDSRIP